MRNFWWLIIFSLLAIFTYWKPVYLFFKRKRILRSFNRDMRALGERMMHPIQLDDFATQWMRARENYDGDDPRARADALRMRMISVALGKRKFVKKEAKQLLKMGGLKPVDSEGLALFSDAAYELDNTTIVRVYFRKNLSVAGFKDYAEEIEQIFIRVLEQKCLSPDARALLKRTHDPIFRPGRNKWKGQLFGSPGHPFPDERHCTFKRVKGELIRFCFDENFNLLVAIGEDRENEIVWERPGARQPELYQ